MIAYFIPYRKKHDQANRSEYSDGNTNRVAQQQTQPCNIIESFSPPTLLNTSEPLTVDSSSTPTLPEMLTFKQGRSQLALSRGENMVAHVKVKSLQKGKSKGEVGDKVESGGGRVTVRD